jgi:hypothetical protein
MVLLGPSRNVYDYLSKKITIISSILICSSLCELDANAASWPSVQCYRTDLIFGRNERMKPRKNCHTEVGFEILMAVPMKSISVWNILPCSLVLADRRSRWMYWFHLQERRVNQAINKRRGEKPGPHIRIVPLFLVPTGSLWAPFQNYISTRLSRAARSGCCLDLNGCLLDLLFDPEDGGNIFFWNCISSYSWTHYTSYRTEVLLTTNCPVSKSGLLGGRSVNQM